MGRIEHGCLRSVWAHDHVAVQVVDTRMVAKRGEDAAGWHALLAALSQQRVAQGVPTPLL